MAVMFQNFAYTVCASIRAASVAWLHETGQSIASQAKENCKLDGPAGDALSTSYQCLVTGRKAKVGTPLEAGFWEEYGTGEYAVHGDGREGWWVTVGGDRKDGKSYKTQHEAEEMADFIRACYKEPAVATNGRPPAYTLENAFHRVMPNAEKLLAQKLAGV